MMENFNNNNKIVALSSRYGLQDLIMLLNVKDPPDEPPWLFLSVQSQKIKVDPEIISRELEDEERNRRQYIQKEEITIDHKELTKDMEKETNNVQSPDKNNRGSIWAISRGLWKDSKDEKDNIENKMKISPKPSIVRDYKTEMEEWQSKMEEESQKIKNQEFKDKQFSHELEHWRNELYKKISDQFVKYNHESQGFLKGRSLNLQSNDRKEFQKDFEKWNINFHEEMNSAKESIESESLNFRQKFVKRLDGLTREVDRMRQMEETNEIPHEDEDEESIVEKRMYSEHMGVELKDDSNSDEEEEGEEEDEDYFSCSDDDEDDIKSRRKSWLHFRQSIEPKGLQ